VPYEESEVCVAAARLAAEMLAQLVYAAAGLPGADAPAPAFAQQIEELLGFAATKMLPVQDRALLRTAHALDIPTSRLAGRILVLGQGRFQRRLSATKTSLTNVVSNDIAANKDYSRRVLAEIGLPIPRYARVYSARDATAAARRIGYPVVVKPNNSGMGAGVSVGMKNRREVSAAYRRARQFDRSVLVEEFIKGAA
jgi:cyanophycin synthetase